MKGLLLKDFYTLFKQMKIILLIIIVFAFIPDSSFSAFAIMYSAMLPITALAYDERSKWNVLASMMPYSKKDLVLSKYLLGYICLGFVTVITLIAKFVISLFGKGLFNFKEIMPIIAMALLGSFLMAVNMPIMNRFGVEKGRLVFIILIILVVSCVTAINNISSLKSDIDIDFIYYIIAAVAIIIINIISVEISVRIRKKN